MFPFSLFITPLSVFLSLSTSTGILVHDTKLDRAALTAKSSHSNSASSQANTKFVNIAPDLHPHSERHSMATKDLKTQNPKVPPRSPAEKKYVSQKNMGLGHNPFDSYALPIS